MEERKYRRRSYPNYIIPYFYRKPLLNPVYSQKNQSKRILINCDLVTEYDGRNSVISNALDELDLESSL